MQLTTSATVDIRGAAPEAVFDYATALDSPPEFFRGYGPVPAIDCLEMLDSAPPAVGALRRVVLADGKQLVEEILELDRPRSHRYRATAYAPPFSWLTREGIGHWTFSPTSHGTRLTWHYAYQLTSPLAWPIGALLIHLVMRRAMQRALEHIRTRFERA